MTCCLHFLTDSLFFTSELLPLLTGHRLQGFRILRYLFENYELDSGRRELSRDTNVVALAPQTFDLLDYLIRNASA